MSSPGRARLFAWLPAGVLAALQFVASSIPGTQYPKVAVPFADKLVHFGVYAVLGAACARGLLASGRQRRVGVVLLAAALAAAFGATDEIHQWFVPFRSCDWRDLVADGLGGLFGALAWTAIARRPPAGA